MPRGNPGIPKSEEHRRKLSIARMGQPGPWLGKKMPEYARAAMRGKRRPLSPEHRAKISAALKERIVPESVRQKFVGKTQSPETRLKKSLSQRGPLGSGWKGGVTPINECIRQSSEFKQWRSAVFEKDNYTCRKCCAKHEKGSRPKLHPHHIKPFAIFPELRFVVENGLTLCEKCHWEVHGRDLRS